MYNTDCKITEFAEIKANESVTRALGADAVRAENVLSGLDCAQKRNTVCAGMHIKFFQRGQTVVYENQQFENYLVLVSGGIIVRKSSTEGRQVTVAKIKPGTGCSINIGCLLKELNSPAELVAQTDLVLGIVPKRNFMRCMTDSNCFRNSVFQDFGQQMNELVEFVCEMAFEPIDVRIAKWLLKTSQNKPCLSVTHQSLADEIGSVREVVSRELKRLKDKGLVNLGQGKLEVLDREGLTRLAEV